jgi:beta-mannosidase
MMTVGPWRPVHLETYSHRFEDARIDTDLTGEGYTVGTLSADVTIGPDVPKDGKIKAVLKKKNGTVVKEETVSVGKKIHWEFEKGEVEGWYPVNYGKQPLYTLELTLNDKVSTILPLFLTQYGHPFPIPITIVLHRTRNANQQDDKSLASSSTSVAFRHARVVQEPLIDQEGTTFLFEINGIRVFCGGSNWIPGDSFLTEMGTGKYEKWMDLMVCRYTTHSAY